MPSLIVIGSGIKFISHLTHEARMSIEQADVVLYLVNEPMMAEWIQEHSLYSESLESLYFSSDLRKQAYEAIKDYILKMLTKHKKVCVVLYGHPTICADPALAAAKEATSLGYDVKILPGISADACLYADLHIDPCTHGSQSFEASDFLIYERQPILSSHLILWQVGSVGIAHQVGDEDNAKNLQVLLDYLEQFYAKEQPIILYEAAQYPGFRATILHTALKELVNAAPSRIATLYIPPAHRAVLSHRMLEQLNLTVSALT